jgi:hypothetical protein
MQIIPIADTYSQTISVQLAGQNCAINLYQKSTGFYCDLYVSGSLVIGGVICQNLNRIVRSVYLGFVGDLCFCDTQGSTTAPSTGLDPSSPGLGTRYLFLYLEASDLNGVG